MPASSRSGTSVRRKRVRASLTLPEPRVDCPAPIENMAAATAITEAMGDGLILVDTAGKVVSVNPAFEALSGYRKAQLVRKEALGLVKRIIANQDAKKVESALAAMRKGKAPAPLTLTLVSKDGGQVPIALTASFVRDGEGRPTVIVFTIKDISELKNAEDALRSSEEYFRALIENALDVVMVLNPDGSIRYQSPSVHRITGYTPEEREGKSVFDLIHPDDLPEMASTFRQILGNEVSDVHTELRIRHKDGSYRHLEAVARNFIDDPKIKGIVSNFRDITERKLAEEALHRSEGKFRALIDNSLDGIVVMSDDGAFRYESPSVAGMLGESRRNKNPFDFVHPDDLPEAARAFANLKQKPEMVSHTEVRARHADGSWRTFEVLGKNLLHDPTVGGIVVNIRDITERKAADEALRAGREYFRALIENSMEGITILEPNGTIRYESPSVERLLGYDPEKLVGRQGMDFVHPDDVHHIVDALKVSSRGKPQSVLVEARFKHNNGSWRILEAIVNNLTNDPVVSGIVVNYRDITERKWAEAELRLKENALENSIAAVAMSDMSGMITYVNRACMRMWGDDKKEDILGKPYWRLLNPSDAAVATNIATAMVEKGFWEGEVGARIADGTERYVRVSAGLVNDEDGNPIQTISTFVDVTEKRKAEEDLRKSEEKFRRFVEEMSDGYCVLEGFTVAFANATGAEMFGYTQSEVTGKTVHELLPPETVDELVEIHKRRTRGEKVPAQYETTLTAKDGSPRPVEFSARVIDYQGTPAVSIVVRDISERKRMERALRDSEAQFRTMFEEAAIGIALVDMTGIPFMVNPALQRMFGFTLDELKAITLTEYIHPTDAPAETALFQAVASGECDRHPAERSFTRKDGRSIWGYQTTTYVRDGEGKPLFAIAMIEDITERRQAEEERERMEQQLQLTGRLAAVGELAAGVAHELNNPLAAVQAYAQFLTSRQGLDEALKKDLETIHKEAQRASRITANLLSFARRHKPEKSLVSINDIIGKSLELHAYRLNVNNVEVKTKLDTHLPRTMVDVHQIQQVFVNLITNAEQAMTAAHAEGKLTIKTRRAGEMIEATFADDGPGIPEENLTRIFDPFFTTKEVGQGTGLGLSICYGIVHEHGGQLYATSKPGEGATFVLRLPIVSEGRPAAENTEPVRVEGD